MLRVGGVNFFDRATVSTARNRMWPDNPVTEMASAQRLRTRMRQSVWRTRINTASASRCSKTSNARLRFKRNRKSLRRLPALQALFELCDLVLRGELVAELRKLIELSAGSVFLS